MIASSRKTPSPEPLPTCRRRRDGAQRARPSGWKRSFRTITLSLHSPTTAYAHQQHTISHTAPGATTLVAPQVAVSSTRHTPPLAGAHHPDTPAQHAQHPRPRIPANQASLLSHAARRGFSPHSRALTGSTCRTMGRAAGCREPLLAPSVLTRARAAAGHGTWKHEGEEEEEVCVVLDRRA